MKKKTVAGLVAGSVVALSSIFAGSTYSLAFADQKKNDDTIVSKEKKSVETTTPIKHVVVIFSENVSFDHYFGTYPNAKNPAGEPKFQAKANTPYVNGLTNELLNHNPNQFNPKRLDRSQAMTDGYGP
ncbi:alkaline phosphatase family protein [Bacillus sp. S13(2024)]|uniref:alkaline phosphatase family protein n=1 Tax=unclassified Bacillus (in: firmicutes) TaxID=185979 RepID=UPI003D193CD4